MPPVTGVTVAVCDTGQEANGPEHFGDRGRIPFPYVAFVRKGFGDSPTVQKGLLHGETYCSDISTAVASCTRPIARRDSMSSSSGHWYERRPSFVWVAAVALLALVLAGDLIRAYQGWPDAQGWEHEWIARAWADGKGYSFPGDPRWLFKPADPGERTVPGGYYATAWEEPVPVFLLGTCFRLFGEHGRLAMTVANVLFFAATLIMVYRLGRRISNPWLGVIAAALVVLIPTVHSLVKVYLGGSILAGLLVSGCALLMLRFLERPSVERALVLGGVIGFAALTHAPTIAFLPVALIVALLARGPLTTRAWASAGVIVGAALLVLSPWVARNYATFGEFVLVKNGAGFMTYLGNRALADTLEPSRVDDGAPFKPPWRSETLLDAVQRVNTTQNLADLQYYSEDTVRALAPDRYAKFNEAQRDKAFMAAALDFMVRHPWTTLQLAAVKAARFLYPSDLGWFARLPATLLGLLALLGLASNLRDRRVTALGLMAIAYAGAYVVTFPFFYRYRYPIEPVLAVLAGIAVIRLAQLVWRLRARLLRAPASDASQLRAGPGG
jgi:4-amino-4-deoxy-L-arabinose transferase-like glycosyltransferase